MLLCPPAAHSAIGKIFISEPPAPRYLSYINRAPHLLSLIGVIGTIPQTKINRPDRKQRGGDRMEVTKKFAKFANFGTDLRFVESRQLIPKVTPNF